MTSQGVSCSPEQVANLKGDEARGQFINLFKEVQRLKTQLDQYTDLTQENTDRIEQIIPKDKLQAFRGVYLETAQDLKKQQDQSTDDSDPIQQLDFEFVLFASTMIDYDYIMKLISNYTQPGKQKMTRDELVGLIEADAKFMNDREDITEYIDTLKTGKKLKEEEIRQGYEEFKTEKFVREVSEIAANHGLEAETLQSFIKQIMRRLIFDGEELSDLFPDHDLPWKARVKKEKDFMQDLIPLLHKLAQGREISGLAAYEK
jgi:type I restriction enzyme R subunit